MKTELHERNRHRERYDFETLVTAYPPLNPYVVEGQYGATIDFFDPEAVLALNRALLAHYYDVEVYDIPTSALVAPIPGRADYIHYLADLVGQKDGVRCLDIGVGANCIYPIVGVKEYGWDFVGSDIDAVSVESAQAIVKVNSILTHKVEIRHQSQRNHIFEGVIRDDEYFDVTLCNPPFHNSAESAKKAAMRKLRNLKGAALKEAKLNFAGRSNELWCKGGERKFVSRMIAESAQFRSSCGWFTSLISSEDNLPHLIKEIAKVGAKHRIIEMSQGNKRSRILAWRFGR